MKIETEFEIGDKIYCVDELDGELVTILFNHKNDLKQFLLDHMIHEKQIHNLKVSIDNDELNILYLDEYEELIGYDGEKNLFTNVDNAIKYATKVIESTFNNWAKQFKNIK